jgi:predicted transglutaminase-like cysteine proteinase
MARKYIATLAFGVALCTANSAFAELRQNAEAQDSDSSFMHEYGRTLPPIGHVEFCERFPSECEPDGTPHPRVTPDEGMRKDMRFVNDLVNEMVSPVTDKELYGRLEHWTYPAGEGDCEDYVLLKRRLLAERGWPENALLITVVRDRNGDGHAVLTVRTADGDLILDNKTGEILTWNESGYTFVKRQSSRDPGVWVSLAPPSPQQDNRNPVSTNE